MTKNHWSVFAVGCALAVVSALPAVAQSEVKEKAPMYSYVSFWAIPRAQWGEMAKSDAANEKMMQSALADGTIIGYGTDTNMVHTQDGYTHDGWWSTTSMAAALKVLEQAYASGSATTSVLTSATKHQDAFLVSRYYNWHAGSWKGAYTRVATYKLKADAPNDALEMLSKHLFVPMLEKLLADGAIQEYEVDTEAIHTDDPGTFSVVIMSANADGLDRFNKAVADLHNSSPFAGPAITSMVDFAQHRDFLARTDVAYK